MAIRDDLRPYRLSSVQYFYECSICCLLLHTTLPSPDLAGDAPSQPPRLNMENLVALVPQYLGEFHVKDVALVLLIINSCLWLVLAAFKKIKTPGYSQPSTPDLEKPASPLRAKSKIDRKPGSTNDCVETMYVR